MVAPWHHVDAMLHKHVFLPAENLVIFLLLNFFFSIIYSNDESRVPSSITRSNPNVIICIIKGSQTMIQENQQLLPNEPVEFDK